MYTIQHLLELARKGGPDLALKRKYSAAATAVEERDRRTHRRYLKILREVKEECGDTALSSDEEGEWHLDCAILMYQLKTLYLGT